MIDVGQICIYNKPSGGWAEAVRNRQLALHFPKLADKTPVLVLSYIGTMAVVFCESRIWHIPHKYLGVCH